MEELPFDPRWGWGDLGMWVWQFQVGVRLSEALKALVRSLIACVSLMWPPAPPLCPVLLVLESCVHLSPPGPGRCELDGRQWEGAGEGWLCLPLGEGTAPAKLAGSHQSSGLFVVSSGCFQNVEPFPDLSTWTPPTAKSKKYWAWSGPGLAPPQAGAPSELSFQLSWG